MEQDMDFALPSIPMELPLGGRMRFEQAWRSVHADSLGVITTVPKSCCHVPH